MITIDLKIFLIFYLIALSLVFTLSIVFRRRFWYLFGRVLPIIFIAHFLLNMLLFPAINQAHIHPAYEGYLHRLPSNELIDLLYNSTSPSRIGWVYPLVEDYYIGRTLLIPNSILDSLDLSLERLRSQGRLADVIITDFRYELTDGDVDQVLDMDFIDLDTKQGDVYYFVMERNDPNAPLVLLRSENQLFFIPEDLLPGGEGDL